MVKDGRSRQQQLCSGGAAALSAYLFSLSLKEKGKRGRCKQNKHTKTHTKTNTKTKEGKKVRWHFFNSCFRRANIILHLLHPVYTEIDARPIHSRCPLTRRRRGGEGGRGGNQLGLHWRASTAHTRGKCSAAQPAARLCCDERTSRMYVCGIYVP